MPAAIKIDLATGTLTRVNKEGAAHAAIHLLHVIDRYEAELPYSLQPLREYAQAALDGQIEKPRDWNGEPLRGTFREGLFPTELDKAYANFTFYTHGLLNGEEPREHRADGQYAIVGAEQ